MFKHYNRLKQHKLVTQLTSHRHFQKYEKYVSLLLWLAVIFFLSSRTLGFLAAGDVAGFVIRKLFHMFEFGLLAYLTFRVIRIAEKRHVYWDLFFAFILSFGYAALDEYHQTFTAGRVGVYTDVLIDTIGILIVIWLLYIHYHHVPKQKIKIK